MPYLGITKGVNTAKGSFEHENSNCLEARFNTKMVGLIYMTAVETLDGIRKVEKRSKKRGREWRSFCVEEWAPPTQV